MGILSKADYIVDIGSHAGSDGGHLVFEGTIDNFLKSNNSITAQCLRDNKKSLKLNYRKGNNELVDKSNTAIMIEHNNSIIREADWIIELGPEGGDKGRDFLKRVKKSRNEVLRIIENSLADDEI